MSRSTLFVSTLCAPLLGFLLVDPGTAHADERATEAKAPSTLEGRLQRTVTDWKDGRVTTRWSIQTDDGPVELGTEDARVDLSKTPVGSRVRAQGEVGPDGFGVESLRSLEPPISHAIDPAEPRDLRLGFVMVHWGEPDQTVEEAEQGVFTSERSLTNYLTEASWGKDRWDGDVLGWYEIVLPNDNGGGPQFQCPNFDGLLVQVHELLRADGIEPADYDHLAMYHPSGACVWNGISSGPTEEHALGYTMYNGGRSCRLLAHEMGHSYGLTHVRSIRACESDADGVPQPFGSACGGGDHPIDPMQPGGGSLSGGGQCLHYSIVNKQYLGWTEGCNTVTVTGDGRFNLVPTALACDGIQNLRIQIGPQFYFLEYRQPLGAFDNHLMVSGVMVSVNGELGVPNDGPGPQAAMLDMSPEDGEINRPFMHEGDTLVDHQGRVTFSVESESPTHAVIVVDFPEDGGGAMCEDGSEPPEVEGTLGVLDCLGAPEPMGSTGGTGTGGDTDGLDTTSGGGDTTSGSGTGASTGVATGSGPAQPQDDDDNAGCGCHSAGGPGWGSGLLMLGLLALRRRKSRKRTTQAAVILAVLATSTTAQAEEEPSAVFFLNYDGPVIEGGPDDATINQGGVCPGTYEVFPEGSLREASIQATRSHWEPNFNVSIVSERPASGDYSMNVVGLQITGNGCGSNGSGKAPLDCGNENPRSVSYTFANDQIEANLIANTNSHEIAHALGLIHIEDTTDIMFPLAVAMPRTFVDDCLVTDVSDGGGCEAEHEEFCPPGQQNAYRELLTMFGPAFADVEPPVVEITMPAEGESFDVPTGLITVIAEGSDNRGIREVRLLINGEEHADIGTSNPTYWGVRDLPDGNYLLEAVATDHSGNETISASVEIIVGEGGPLPSDTEGDTDGDDDPTDGLDADTDDFAGQDDGDGGGCRHRRGGAPPWLAALALGVLFVSRKR